MKLIVKTGIFVNQPTINGRIWTDATLRKVAKLINEGDVRGGIIDSKTGKPQNNQITHKVSDAMMVGHELHVELIFLDESAFENVVKGLGPKLRAIPTIVAKVSNPEPSSTHTIRPEHIVDVSFVNLTRDQ